MPQDPKLAENLKREAQASGVTPKKAYKDAVRRAAVEYISNKGKMSTKAAERAVDSKSPAYANYVAVAKRKVKEEMSKGKHTSISNQGSSAHK